MRNRHMEWKQLFFCLVDIIFNYSPTKMCTYFSKKINKLGVAIFE